MIETVNVIAVLLYHFVSVTSVYICVSIDSICILIVTEDYLPRDTGNASLQNTVFQHVWEEVDTEIQVKGFKNMNACTCTIICLCINIYISFCFLSLSVCSSGCVSMPVNIFVCVCVPLCVCMHMPAFSGFCILSVLVCL